VIFLEPLNGLVLALLGVVGGERHQPKFCNQTGATDHLWRRGLAGPFGFGSSCGLSLSRAKAAQTAKADRQPTQELREKKRHSMFFRCAINCQPTLIDICWNYLNDDKCKGKPDRNTNNLVFTKLNSSSFTTSAKEVVEPRGDGLFFLCQWRKSVLAHLHKHLSVARRNVQ